MTEKEEILLKVPAKYDKFKTFLKRENVTIIHDLMTKDVISTSFMLYHTDFTFSSIGIIQKEEDIISFHVEVYWCKHTEDLPEYKNLCEKIQELGFTFEKANSNDSITHYLSIPVDEFNDSKLQQAFRILWNYNY